MIRHVLLKRKNNIGSVVDIVSVCKVLSVFCIMFVLFVGCGSGNLDNPKVREKIAAKAIDWKLLGTSDGLTWLPGQKQPYTGWEKFEQDASLSIQQYQNGKKHGAYIKWGRYNQVVLEKGFFKNGQKDGVWTQWDYSTGKKLQSETYKDGKKIK